MATAIADRVKAASAGLPGEALLRAPLTALLGVSDAARDALEPLGIRTVFDLAAADLFAIANTLLSAESDPTLAESRHDAIAADAARPPPGIPAAELARQPITILKGVDAAGAAALSEALGVDSVRELALWPPYRSARSILAETFFPGASQEVDPGALPELLPLSGVYPTERVLLRKLVLDLAPQPQAGVEAIEDAGPIDLGEALSAPTAFNRVATGALLTFSQSWFSQGLTLGQLLHSMSLAPGESTRIAMIDWTRRSTASATESIGEAERLSSAQVHNRALSEVTSATATEFQAGASQTSVSATTGQGGVGIGVDLGIFALGGAGGAATTTTEVMTASSSFGTRNLAASMAQEINDRSQQNASSARTRRASVVREVSQQEHETISTRVVTNYNHMHALTIQYYEVVQAFRVTTKLDRAERCLFVPLKLLDFRNPATVDRLRPILANAALTGRALRQLTTEYGVVEVIPETPRVVPGRLAVADVAAVRRVADDNPSGPTPSRPRSADAQEAVLAFKGWNVEQVTRLGGIGGRAPVRTGSDSVFVPDETQLLSVSLRAGQAGRFELRRRDGQLVTAMESAATSFVPGSPVPIGDLATIGVQHAADAELQTALVLHLSVLGSTLALDVPVRLRPGGPGARIQEIVRFGAIRAAGELVEHLEANRLHYSRAVFRALDAATIAGLLGRFTYRGLPLSHVVEPEPFAVTANFLVFRMNVPQEGDLEDERFRAEQQAWQEFLVQRGLDAPAPQSEVIPLPSGGVFAEAVLGRFNSAERIDLGRFWNWQDSPIPVTAPEIAAVSAGSRAIAEDLMPGRLGAPVVSIQAPTALPAAAGTAAMLGALQSASIFRDMSGIAQTAALAQAAAQASGAGATAAGDQAAKNLFNVMDQHTQRMRIAADLAGSMLGTGAGSNAGDGKPAAGRGTPTERGIRLAEARALDEKATAVGAGAIAGGAAGASASAPASLEQEVVRAQSGVDAARTAEALGEAATRPPAPVDAQSPSGRSRTAVKKPPAGPQGVEPEAPVPGNGEIQRTLPAPVPRRFLLRVEMGATNGFRITGDWGLRLKDGGRLVFDLFGTRDAAIQGGFTAESSIVALEVKAQSRPQGIDLDGFQTVLLPPRTMGQLGASLTGAEVTVPLSIAIRPILKTAVFKVATLGPTLMPDMADLESQLTTRGIDAARRAGEPKFELEIPGGLWRATVTWFTGKLMIRQIID